MLVRYSAVWPTLARSLCGFRKDYCTGYTRGCAVRQNSLTPPHRLFEAIRMAMPFPGMDPYLENPIL